MKNIITITSVALTTAALTILSFWSTPIEAGDEGKAPKVAQPKLVIDGMEMTLVAANGKTFQAGDEPEFQLTAINTGSEPASANLVISMNSGDEPNPFSRIKIISKPVWTENCTIALGANEKKTLMVSTKTKLTTNKTYTVALEAKSTASSAENENPGARQLAVGTPSRISALRFSTVTKKADDGKLIAKVK